MKRLLISLGLVFSLMSLNAQETISAAQIVDKQLDAYNAKDIEAFLNTYSDHIQVFEFGKDVPMIEGKERLRSTYTNMFDGSPSLNASVTNRIIRNNKIINHEIAMGIYAGDPMEVVVIYEVNDGLIERVTFIY